MPDTLNIPNCTLCGATAHMQLPSFPMTRDSAEIRVACDKCGAVGPAVTFDLSVHDANDLPALQAEALAAWISSGPFYMFVPASGSSLAGGEAMPQRKDCKCPCHKLGIALLHVRPCCRANDAPATDARDPLRDIVLRYIDRMNDIAPECGDPADRILGEFAREVNAVLKAERGALAQPKGGE